jgi:hypothetical protein
VHSSNSTAVNNASDGYATGWTSVLRVVHNSGNTVSVCHNEDALRRDKKVQFFRAESPFLLNALSKSLENT